MASVRESKLSSLSAPLLRRRWQGGGISVYVSRVALWEAICGSGQAPVGPWTITASPRGGGFCRCADDHGGGAGGGRAVFATLGRCRFRVSRARADGGFPRRLFFFLSYRSTGEFAAGLGPKTNRVVVLAEMGCGGNWRTGSVFERVRLEIVGIWSARPFFR